MSALTLYAKASADFAAKLAETKAVLLSAAQTFSPLTQASSLGAEDMVITHLLGEVGIDYHRLLLSLPRIGLPSAPC
jgi:phosphoadenosine phosphosulfate reductase